MKRTRKSQAKSDVSTTSSTSYTGLYSNRLTIEELKSFPGCENIDNMEAEKIIQSLYELSLLSYDILYK
jgi:hypothetical protein